MDKEDEIDENGRVEIDKRGSNGKKMIKMDEMGKNG